VGGAGNDTFIGGPNRSLLIGGAGADVIVGGSEDDILIGGKTSYDANTTALNAILNEWKRSDLTCLDRIDNLNGTVSGGLNGSFDLNSTTVIDDHVADTLLGGAGQNWFWANLGEAIDIKPGERRN